MKYFIYLVFDACSGEDYSADEPNLLFVSKDKKEARQFFDDEISNWEDGLEDFDSDLSNDSAGNLIYECTDFEGDSHRVMKLMAYELK